MRILILGIGGMLGNSLYRELNVPSLDVFGSLRNIKKIRAFFPTDAGARLIDGVDAYKFDSVEQAANMVNPDVLINCIGLIRQLPEGKLPLPCIEINARFPHLLAKMCRERHIRLIHYSTDCVFDGAKGAPYTEDDPPSAKDIYGLSKFLGEVRESPALTIRTSIIGHELRNKLSLVEWFLAQKGTVKGYTQAIYSGLPVTEHARILREYVLPNPALTGLYQVAGRPISKYELLQLVAREYGKKISIEPEPTVREDKRLSGDAFFRSTGYVPPEWPELIRAMRAAHQAVMGDSAV
ncbi:NAD-dependent epimerase/dehydratase [uncultured delta proteobacterium]|uniref:dTDP-4-dehydrorhamnose reductase n=1 Tax=uncultured delta proteobacterium TaxID=34034 RepID=A0A212KH17_9DELT|nr:NAD-dependent epimerase/dehydratase [uncultured delta proteobacterium]